MLDLSKEQQAVQAVHVAYEAGMRFANHASVVFCGVESIDSVIEHLDRLGIRYVSFREPDLGNIVTAVATETISDRKPLRKYKLWRA